MPLLSPLIWRCSNPNDRKRQNLYGIWPGLMNWSADTVQSARNWQPPARTPFTSGAIVNRDSCDLAPLNKKRRS
jgi:hypothetical protein